MSDSATRRPAGFDQFGLHDYLMRGIRDAGFETPRPIQVETIPAGLDGRDVLGLAQTGTGKTAAFALPLLDRLLDSRDKGPRALVVAPTRELATQISEEIRVLFKHTRMKLVTVFGGAPMHRQISQLRLRPEVVVGCPGRMLDLLDQGVLRLDRVETLVLDEADHMFDMGFLPDIRRILKALPTRRQNLLFSATMPKEIRRLADDLLQDPHVVDLATSGPAETIEHDLVLVEERRKRELLERMLSGKDCESAIVFTRTKHRAKRLAEQLSKVGHRAVGLQGNLSQPQRDRAMRGFRTRQFDVLVATDIVARGIDVSGVSHVINYDVPNTPEAYTHRIGRTGRAELEGRACTFVTGADHGWLRATERMIGKPIPRREVAGISADGPAPHSPQPRNRGRNPRPDGSSPNPRNRARNSRPDGPASSPRNRTERPDGPQSSAQNRLANGGRRRRRRG